MRTLLKKNYFLTYTIVFFVVSAIVFLPFIICGRSFVSMADGYNQSYPAYIYIGRWFKESLYCIFTHNPIPTFDFSIGFGNDIITTLNCYGLGDIFNLTALFSSQKNSQFLLTLTILLKIYTSGISFSVWGLYHKLSHPSLLAAALFYAFSGFTYLFGLQFPFFLVAQVTLPLFILGIDICLESKQVWETSCILILSIFIQALNGFYSLYMETIFAIIYFVVNFFVVQKGPYKRFFLYALNVAWQYLLGIGMASVFFVPVLLEFLKCPRSSESSLSLDAIIKMFPLNTWIERLEGLLSGPGYNSGLGLCAIAVACIIFLFTTPHKNLDLKILLAIFGISYCFPITGSIMNGFSYSTERYIFLIYFLIAVVMVKIIPELVNIQKFQLTVLFSILAIWIITLFTINELNIQSLLRMLLLGLSWISIIYLLFKRPKLSILSIETLLSILSIIGVILVGVFNNFPEVVGAKGFSALFKEYDIYEEISNSKFSQYAYEDTTNENVLRTDIYDTCQNAATILNVNGTSSYYSISNSSIYDFLNEYLVSPGIEGSSFTFRGLDSRLALEMLLSVGSYTDTISAENIYKNPFTLPLGFTFDSYILQQDAQKCDVLDRNNSLIQTVTLETSPQKSLDLIQIKQLDTQWENVSTIPLYENIDVNKNILDVVGPNATIHIPIEETQFSKDVEYYLYFNNLIYMGNEIWQDLDIEGKTLRLRPLGSYSGQQNTYMVKIPITSELMRKKSIDIIFPAPGKYFLDNVELRKLNISSYSDIYNSIFQTHLQNLAIKSNEISGTLQTDSDKILFMSIPYSAGWTSYIDGEQTPVLKANVGFCAIEVPKGNHEIVWKYNTPGLKLALSLSTISCLLFILILVSKIWRQKKKNMKLP